MVGSSKKRHSSAHTGAPREKQIKRSHPSTQSPPPPSHTSASPCREGTAPPTTITSTLLQPPAADHRSSPSPSLSSTSHAAHRAHLAHTAPHLFPEQNIAHPSPSPSSSRSPSPSLGAFPRHQDSNQHVGTSSSRHIVPHKYRGPLPRDSDAHLVAPHPALQLAPTASALAPDHLYTAPYTPLNRNSWRYTFAGPDTTLFPTSVYKSIPSVPHQVRWDWSDRSPFTQISRQADVLTSDRGWRSARGNVPVRQGSWYCEIQILHPDLPLSTDSSSDSPSAVASPMDTPTTSSYSHHPHPHGLIHSNGTPMKDGPHVRVGWGRREAPLNAPVGFDGYSYGLRDTTGQRVFLSRPTSYASGSFSPGDTIGLYIRLPPLGGPLPRDTKDPRHIRRKWIPIRYRGQVYFEQLDYTQTREMERLMDKSWSGEKLLRSDGGLNLRRIKSLTGQVGHEEAEWVEIDQGDGEGGEDEEVEMAARAGGSGAKMKKQKAVKKASSTPTPAPGGASSKGKGNNAASAQKGSKGARSSLATNSAEDDKQKTKRTLRPLPTLGPTSRVGFFLNGEPLGWAFRDLLDFRPLRQPGGSGPSGIKAGAGGSLKKGGAARKKQVGGDVTEGHADILPSQLVPASLASLSPLGLDGVRGQNGVDKGIGIEDQNISDTGDGASGGMDFLSTPLLTSSASLSAIMKSRENPYDDGCCGYFPMVSLYGGARARLIAKEEEMRFIPRGGLKGIERGLEEAERKKREKGHGMGSGEADREDSQDNGVEEEEQPWWGQTRPLEELYTEHWNQQHLLDLEEEERAKVRARWIKALTEEDEDEENENENKLAGDGEQEERSATEETGGRIATSVGTAPGKKKGAGAGRKSSTLRDVTSTPTPAPQTDGMVVQGATQVAIASHTQQDTGMSTEIKAVLNVKGEPQLADSAPSPSADMDVDVDVGKVVDEPARLDQTAADVDTVGGDLPVVKIEAEAPLPVSFAQVEADADDGDDGGIGASLSSPPYSGPPSGPPSPSGLPPASALPLAPTPVLPPASEGGSPGRNEEAAVRREAQATEVGDEQEEGEGNLDVC